MQSSICTQICYSAYNSLRAVRQLITRLFHISVFIATLFRAQAHASEREDVGVCMPAQVHGCVHASTAGGETSVHHNGTAGSIGKTCGWTCMRSCRERERERERGRVSE